MSEVTEICFYCQNWEIDPGAFDRKLQRIVKNIDVKGRPGVPKMYGKCKASFIGKDNVPEDLNKGTLSLQECDVTDYDGFKVFREVPED